MSLVTSRLIPVAAFLMETLAPAMAAPDWSFTVPVRVAPTTCPYSRPASTIPRIKARNRSVGNCLVICEDTFSSVIAPLSTRKPVLRSYFRKRKPGRWPEGSPLLLLPAASQAKGSKVPVIHTRVTARGCVALRCRLQRQGMAGGRRTLRRYTTCATTD